jgi:hypothetical protein
MTATMTEDAFKRVKRLQRMAEARGCELHEVYDYAAPWAEDKLDYLLYVPDPNGDRYPEPVEFDDMDEVEADLNSRPVVEAAR